VPARIFVCHLILLSAEQRPVHDQKSALAVAPSFMPNDVSYSYP